MSYYHTYRPQQFADLLGQDYVRAVLQEAIRANRLSHAYLFAGTRGTGKTSTARILAKAILCPQGLNEGPEPCNACDVCQAVAQGSFIDVIEIDAASNRGIDEIRSLQEQVRFRPQTGKKKIFIIDEVHMLTKEAFNALLKTLEEPPEYLLFILATTEPHKLPATVISRCQRFDFMTPTADVIAGYLERIASQEKLKVASEAIHQLAQLAHGSFRDSATLIEQLAASGEAIGLDQVIALLGLPEDTLVDRYLEALGTLSDSDLTDDLQVYFARGGNPSAFIDRAFDRLQARVLAKELTLDVSKLLARLVQIKYQMKQSPLPQLPLLVGCAPDARQQPTLSDKVSAKPAVHSKPILPEAESIPEDKPPVVIVSETKASDEKAKVEKEMVSITVAEQVPLAEVPSGEIADKWQQSLQKLMETNQSSLVAILRTARPLSFASPLLKIAVQFKFHADQLTRQKNRAALEAIFSEIFGTPVHIDMEVQPVPDLTEAAEEIFT